MQWSRHMTKKTTKGKSKRKAAAAAHPIARAASTLQTAINALQIDKSQIALATGAFALGGLCTALARDEEVRAHSRALAVAVLDKVFGLVTDKRGSDETAIEQHH